MAWKDGLRDVWSTHGTPPPRPPDELLGDPALIGAWRRGAAFGEDAWDRYPRLDENANVRASLLSTPCGRVPTQSAVLTPTTPVGAAPITAGATPTSLSTPTPFPPLSEDSDFARDAKHEADVRATYGHPRALETIDAGQRGAHYRRSRLDADRLAVPEVPLVVDERLRLPRAARRAGCDVHRSSQRMYKCIE